MSAGPFRSREHKLNFFRRRLVGWLLDDGCPDSIALAGILQECSPSQPCNSGACPGCGGRWQMTMVGLVDTAIRTPARAKLRGRTTALSLVPHEGCVASAAPSVELLEWVRNAVAGALKAAAIQRCLGSIDVSYNEDPEVRFQGHWCGHAHLVVLDWLNDARLAILRAHFPRTELVSKPVDPVCLDNRIEGRLYVFKPERVRRVSYTVPASKIRNAYRDTHRRELRPGQAVALALIEHEAGFAGRLIANQIPADLMNTAMRGFV